MKKGFIRTPSEIYDLDDLYVCEELNGKPYGVKGSGFCIYKESIINKNKDIFPLLDTFFQQIPDCPFPYENEWCNIYYTQELIYANGGVVYGAIWNMETKIQQLKIVAVMNEQGEWKLL